MRHTCFFRRFKYDAHSSIQGVGDATQSAKGMTFVTGRLKPTDLLLGRFEKFREILLGKPSLLAERGDLQGYIPGLASALKPGGKSGIL